MGRTLCGLGSDEGYVDAFVVEDRERLGWCVAGRDEVRDIAAVPNRKLEVWVSLLAAAIRMRLEEDWMLAFLSCASS